MSSEIMQEEATSISKTPPCRSKIKATKNNSSLSIYSSSLDQILDEMDWIDLIVCHQVERWRKSGKNPDFLGLYISEEEIDSLLAKKESVISNSAEVNALRQKIEERKRISLQNGVELRLERFRELFQLTVFEVDAVLMALASELDQKYSKLFAYLQDDVTKKKPTIGLVLSFFCKSKQDAINSRAYFSYNSPLMKNMIFQLEDGDFPLLQRGIKLDDRILGFLLGSDELDVNVAAFASWKECEVEFAELTVPDDLKLQLLALSKDDRNDESLFLLQGSYDALEVAGAFCREIGVPLLVADLERIKVETFEANATLLLREAKLQNAGVYLDKFDSVSEEGKKFLLDLLEHFGRLIFVPSKSELCMKNKTVKVTLPKPSFAARLKMWENFIGKGENAKELAAKFKFGRSKIAAAVESARSHVVLRNSGDPSLTLDDFYAGCRAQSRDIPFTTKITPGYTWSDIVLPDDKKQQLLEICSFVRHHATVYEEWGFDRHSRGKGLNVLFSGPSGTGKTMAAEIVAGNLQLDMYKIDLSMVVSKYIGKTEKNLNRIFKDAEECNAVLFFDEADALFGKRSEVKDAHDRYANVEINYLLQKMEEHEGIVILATNMSKNVDDAFLRRMTFIVEFPFPSEEYRKAIWRKIFPEQTPLGTIDYEFLSKLQISGGNIKNIALTAAFLAAETSCKVHMEHIIKASRREFQKMGKVCGKEEFGKYYHLIE